MHAQFQRPRCAASAILPCILLSASAAWAADGSPTTVQHANGLWRLENAQLVVTVDPKVGSLAVQQKATGRQWRQPPRSAPADGADRFRDVHTTKEGAPGIVFEADFHADNKPISTMSVTLRLAPNSSDLRVEADMRDRNAALGQVPFFEPLLLDSANGVLAVADYADGHLYPLDLQPFPKTWFSASRLDMPWVGVCDLAAGNGYVIILETSDNAYVECFTHPAGGHRVTAPRVGWIGSQGRFAYPRRLLYHFADKGGYVALAKRYRAYAKEHGLLVTLAEKAKKNANVARLFGAPDVWGWGGESGFKAVREAKAAGIEKMLVHGRFSPADMQAINDLGYLTSEYDNYVDVLPVAPGEEISNNRDLVPDHVVLLANGERKKAWLTADKKQYMKRCPTFWVPAAQHMIPKVLKTYPFLGRFIDVTTADNLYECFDPKHPLTHAEHRACGQQLLDYVGAQNLVVGGEHGIWWGVPHLDYIEGMMSGGYYSWPAGYLMRPKSKDDVIPYPGGGKPGPWAGYEKWGIGHQYRAPLWELVFHDCVVSTWYWGDSSDYLLQAAPEVQAKKDAFNILYGTVPLLWGNDQGSWTQARDKFLQTYRNTCKLHAAVACAELLTHEFVTADHNVQRTRFADGTEALVNFGAAPQTVQQGGRSHTLPQNGFAVKGPRIEQTLELVDGQPVTTIRAGDYFYSDAQKPAAAQP